MYSDSCWEFNGVIFLALLGGLCVTYNLLNIVLKRCKCCFIIVGSLEKQHS